MIKFWFVEGTHMVLLVVALAFCRRLTAETCCVSIYFEFLNAMLRFIKFFYEFFHLSLGWSTTRFSSELKCKIVLYVRLHLIVLNDLRLDGVILSKVDSELLGHFLTHEPSEWALARPQQRRLILHLLDLYLDELLIRHCHSLILVFICRLRAWLQYDLGVVHVHHLRRHVLLKLFLVVLLLLVVHIFFLRNIINRVRFKSGCREHR